MKQPPKSNRKKVPEVKLERRVAVKDTPAHAQKPRLGFPEPIKFEIDFANALTAEILKLVRHNMFLNRALKNRDYGFKVNNDKLTLDISLRRINHALVFDPLPMSIDFDIQAKLRNQPDKFKGRFSLNLDKKRFVSHIEKIARHQTPTLDLIEALIGETK